MRDKYYIRGCMRYSGEFQLEFLTIEARTREMSEIIGALQNQLPRYVISADSFAKLHLKRKDLVVKKEDKTQG